MIRWVKKEHQIELYNLWHLSRVLCNTRYDRLLWVKKEFTKIYPEYTEMQVYKDLSNNV